jgi:hypothetical protein
LDHKRQKWTQTTSTAFSEKVLLAKERGLLKLFVKLPHFPHTKDSKKARTFEALEVTQVQNLDQKWH